MIEKYFVKQAIKKLDLERFFEKHFARAGFNSLYIVKTPVSTRLVVSVARPGIAIGYSGKAIKGIGQIVEEKFGIKNPHIEIKSVEDPEYNVKYIVQTIVNDLEKGINWKQVAYKAVKSLSDMPIMGFELIFKGKMMSKGGRKQKYRFVSGYLKAIGDQTKLVKQTMAAAYTKSGAIGVRLRLVPPNTLFPDKIGEKEISNAIKGDVKKIIIEDLTQKEPEKESEKELEKKEKVVEYKPEESKKEEKKKPKKEEKVVEPEKEVSKEKKQEVIKEKIVEHKKETKEEKKEEPKKEEKKENKAETKSIKKDESLQKDVKTIAKKWL